MKNAEAFDELAKRQGGGYQAKRQMAADKQHWDEEDWRRNEWRCGHGWLRGEQCEICNAAQKPVECLDCGSHNIGIPATYDSLVNSVKAQPAQEPVAWRWGNKKWRYTTYKTQPDAIPLYTAPPQRPWVGLTDDEIAQGNKESWVDRQAFESAVWWAEAKLKERNS